MPPDTKPIQAPGSDGKGPGEFLMSAESIIAVAIYLVMLSVLILYGLVKLWPHPTPSGLPKDSVRAAAAAPSPAPPVGPPSPAPSPSPAGAIAGASPPGTPRPSIAPSPITSPTPPATPSPSPTPPPDERTKQGDPEAISFFSGWFTVNVYAETRLLLLVMLAGALGSLLHALRSLYWYTGNRMMVWSWAAFYLLLPFTGAVLAVIFYFVVRGGFFSPQASFEQTSPFGFAALSALVGLFSSQATLKLKDVAETIFTKPGSGSDAKTQETSDSATDTQAGSAGQAGSSAGAAAGTASTTSTERPVTGEGGDVDLIDGCDVELKADTSDEELPITEGGVG